MLSVGKGIWRPPPWLVIVLLLGYLGTAWMLFLAVDVFDLFGLRRALFPEGGRLWYPLFSEGRWTEWLQWMCLLAATVYGGIAAGRSQERGDVSAATFWWLMSIGTALMLIEDMKDPSHRVGRLLEQLIGEGGIAWQTGRLMVFLPIAGVLLYAVLFLRHSAWKSRETRRYHLLGFGAYAVAATANVPGNLVVYELTGKDIYGWVGDYIVHELLGGRLEPMPEGMWGLEDPTGTVLMDLVFEESIELIGAMFLLAAVLAYLGFMSRASGSSDAPDASNLAVEQGHS